MLSYVYVVFKTYFNNFEQNTVKFPFHMPCAIFPKMWKKKKIVFSYTCTCIIPPFCTCPGHFCVIGSQAPTPCVAGTYTNQTRSTACIACPEGHYCPVNTSDPIPCPAGYWCPASSELPYQNPCPAGKFNNDTGQIAATDCIACPAG